MRQKITIKMWVTVFFGGIWQFICNIFSWENKTPFWRVIGATLTICILAFTCMLGYAFYDEVYGRDHRYANYYERTALGEDFYFFNKGKGKSYITDKNTGKKIIKGLDWIARPQDGDSLVVFAKDGKRGFLSCLSGNIIIPATYDAAWCFNDGVAGVCIGDSVFFIDHSGKPINRRKYHRKKGMNYSYHGNYTRIDVAGMKALVDTNGYIVTNNLYDDLVPMANNMWLSKFRGKMGAISKDGVIIVPNEYKNVEIYPEGGIVVIDDDNNKKRLDYNGNVTDDFVYDCAYTLEYYSDVLDKDGNRIQKPANLLTYSSNGYYGLIDKNGHPVTPPIYSSISAYKADLFECQIAHGGEFLILNEKGKKVNN